MSYPRLVERYVVPCTGLSRLISGDSTKQKATDPGGDKNSYWRRECMVFLDNDFEQPLTVVAYFGDPQSDPPLPNAAYKDLILSGAHHWHLPLDYVRELERIEVDG